MRGTGAVVTLSPRDYDAVLFGLDGIFGLAGLLRDVVRHC
jgi:hypothetical protein